MHAQIHTIAFRSIETIATVVKAYTVSGFPAMVIVGLALPPKRITANLALAAARQFGSLHN